MRAMKRWQLSQFESLEGRATPASVWSLHSDGWVDRVAKNREPVQLDTSIAMAISAAMRSGGALASQASVVVTTSRDSQSQPIGSLVISNGSSSGNATAAPAQDAVHFSGVAVLAQTLTVSKEPFTCVMRMMPDGSIVCRSEPVELQQ